MSGYVYKANYLIQDCVEVIDGEREDVAVRLSADARDSPCVGQETDLAEVGSVREACGHLAVRHDNVDDALLDEVHLGANRALFDDDITWVDAKHIAESFYSNT